MRISLFQEEIIKNNPELQKKLHPIGDSINNAIKIFLVKKERKIIIERNFDNNNENCIEFLYGERYAVATFTNRKRITRLKKIYAERKDEIKYFKENKDGSICVKFPLK